MIRKAQINDVKEIQKLLMKYASQGDMLSRSLSELYESLRDFYVYADDGTLLGPPPSISSGMTWPRCAPLR